MKHTFFILILAYFNANSQTNMITSGGSVLTGDGIISYSVGQVFTNYIETENNTLQEGVHHPHEIHDVVSAEDYVNVAMKIWPNPFHNLVSIDLDTEDIDNFTYVFTTIAGEEICKGQLFSTNNIVANV